MVTGIKVWTEEERAYGRVFEENQKYAKSLSPRSTLAAIAGDSWELTYPPPPGDGIADGAKPLGLYVPPPYPPP
jgi:hypothetical protein